MSAAPSMTAFPADCPRRDLPRPVVSRPATGGPPSGRPARPAAPGDGRADGGMIFPDTLPGEGLNRLLVAGTAFESAAPTPGKPGVGAGHLDTRLTPRRLDLGAASDDLPSPIRDCHSASPHGCLCSLARARVFRIVSPHPSPMNVQPLVILSSEIQAIRVRVDQSETLAALLTRQLERERAGLSAIQRDIGDAIRLAEEGERPPRES